MATRSQQGIRAIIHTLLSILEDSGVPRIPSESFRKAKFNQPNVIESFWNTLLHVIYLARFLGCSTPTNRFHTTKGVALYVRRHLFHFGYTRTGFYLDPVSSRELVLVLAWLLHKTDLFNRLTRHHLTAVNRVYIPVKPGRKFLLDLTDKDIAAFREEVQLIEQEITMCTSRGESSGCLDELEAVLKKMVWLKGKLDCRWKSALSSQHGYQKMADKIHRFTQNSSHKEHLTVHEVFLLRYPDQMSGYLKKLEKHLSALQKLLEWQSCEPLFWQWMESVLDLDEKEKMEEKMSNVDLSEEESHEQSVAKISNKAELEVKLRTLEKDVSTLLERNQPHIDKINRTWQIKSRSAKLEDIQTEISHIQSHPGLNMKCMGLTEATDNTMVVEQLEGIDLPLRLTKDSFAKQPSRKSQLPFSNSALEQNEVYADLLRFLDVRIEQVQRELEANKERIERTTTAITKQLETIEQGFPPSVCKLET